MTDPRMPGSTASPLEGVRVVEFCQIASGPYAGMLLADFGAQVLKVEPPEGDAMRAWPPLSQGYSENFASLNRGKESIALDLKDPAARDLARHLVLESDVLLENSRPGAMQRLGLGWDWFAEHKPTLVYCSISAYGQDGPRGGEGGFDVTIQAAAGVMSVTGEPDGDPVKAGVPLADFASGLYAAYSIAALLARVRAGGAGGHIDVPMFGATLAISALQTSEYFGTGRNPRKLGSAHPRNAPYQAYAARDGWFVIAAGNNRLWEQVCAVVEATAQQPGRSGIPAEGHPAVDGGGPQLPTEARLVADPRFATPALRARHQSELKALLDPVFAQRSAADWLASFAGAGVPCAPINGYAEALADPQARHLGLVQAQLLPGGAHTSTVACPVRIDGQVPPVDTRPPALDEHGPAWRERLRAATAPTPTP